MNHVSATSRGLDPVARAREIGPLVAEAADQIERDQQIPAPLLAKIIEARLPRMLLPRSAGGDEVEPWIYLRAIEEISRHDGSVGWNLFVANSAALIAPFIPLSAAKAIYDDPRGWIAWGPPNQYTATAVPGGYRISGEWHFASGSRQATWMGAHGHVIEPDGCAAAEPVRPADDEDVAVPEAQSDADPRLGHARHARHRVRGLSPG